MKKAIALLATLVVLTGTTFAQLAPTISVSAETKWGVNLDKDNATGFENDADITVIVPLTTEGAENITSSSSIALTGVELSINIDDGDYEENDAGDLEAKLLFGDAYVLLGTNSGFEFNYADSSVDYYDIHSMTQGYAGITFGYDTDMFNFAVNVNSRFGYDPDDGSDYEVDSPESNFIGDFQEETDNVDLTVNEENEYNYGVTFGVNPMDMVNLEVSLATITKKDNYSMLTAGGKIYGTIMEGLTYTIPADYISIDVDGSDDDITAMELFPTVNYAGANGFNAGVGFYYLTLSENAEGNPTHDDTAGTGENAFVAGTSLSDDMDYSILTFNLGYGTDMFNVALASEISLTENDEEEEFTITADVTPVAGAKLYTEVTYSVEAEKTELGKVGVEFTSDLTGIENTVFTIQYEGMVKVDGADEDGIFFVGAKITL